jgi:hypothetical protein
MPGSPFKADPFAVTLAQQQKSEAEEFRQSVLKRRDEDEQKHTKRIEEMAAAAVARQQEHEARFARREEAMLARQKEKTRLLEKRIATEEAAYRRAEERKRAVAQRYAAERKTTYEPRHENCLQTLEDHARSLEEKAVAIRKRERADLARLDKQRAETQEHWVARSVATRHALEAAEEAVSTALEAKAQRLKRHKEQREAQATARLEEVSVRTARFWADRNARWEANRERVLEAEREKEERMMERMMASRRMQREETLSKSRSATALPKYLEMTKARELAHPTAQTWSAAALAVTPAPSLGKSFSLPLLSPETLQRQRRHGSPRLLHACRPTFSLDLSSTLQLDGP